MTAGLKLRGADETSGSLFSYADLEERISAWFRRARCSKLAPFKKLAMILKAHCDGILNGLDSALTNGSVEAINGLMQVAKARTRGCRKPRNLILTAYLIAGKLSHLSATPYTITSGGCRA